MGKGVKVTHHHHTATALSHHGLLKSAIPISCLFSPSPNPGRGHPNSDAILIARILI